MKHCFRFLAVPTAEKGPASFGPIWRIAGEEYGHLKKVLRLGPGDEVEVFDGKGLVAKGAILRAAGDHVLVEAQESQSFAPTESPLTLLLGALRPGFVDELLPSLVELGLDELHVFLPEKVAKDRLNSKTKQRWQRIALAAAKQSKRAFIPLLFAWGSLEEALQTLPAQPSQRLFFTVGGASIQALLPWPLTKGPLLAVVGGEKGLEAGEEALLEQKGFARVGLGPHTLRAYTAALAATTLLSMRRW